MTFWKYRAQAGKRSDNCAKTVHGLHRFSMWLALCVCLSVTFPAQAHAQSASFRAVDTNRDGVLSRDELIAEFGRAGAERLLRQSDRNNDNTLTIQELRQRSDDDRDTDRTARDNADDSDDTDTDNDGDDRGDDGGGDDGGGDDGDDD